MQVQNASEIYNLIGNGLLQVVPKSVIILMKFLTKKRSQLQKESTV